MLVTDLRRWSGFPVDSQVLYPQTLYPAGFESGVSLGKATSDLAVWPLILFDQSDIV